jgi:hypothetical protein
VAPGGRLALTVTAAPIKLGFEGRRIWREPGDSSPTSLEEVRGGRGGGWPDDG